VEPGLGLGSLAAWRRPLACPPLQKEVPGFNPHSRPSHASDSALSARSWP